MMSGIDQVLVDLLYALLLLHLPGIQHSDQQSMQDFSGEFLASMLTFLLLAFNIYFFC